ncbi:MAG: hypothetical protein M3Z18_00975 [Gemmatimonadota bacterium]|nr:hypothetical protein [Gemmatimonadota bacterium]
MPNPNYPPSPWEAGVAGFLNSYAAMKGLRIQEQDAADRKQAATDADQLNQVRLGEAGYTRQTMPKIEAPPDQSFEQKIGSFLSNHFGSGSSEPSSFLVKDHPSVRESEIANEQTFDLTRDAAHFKNERDIEGIRAAIETNRTNKVIAAENTRSAANNRTSIAVANIDHATQHEALGNTEKHAVVDDAINATGGYAQNAWNQIPDATKKKYNLTPLDMNAGTQRFMDRKAELARESNATREDIAAQRGGTQIMPRDPTSGQPITPPSPPGISGRSGSGAQQGADWDRAAAAAKAQGKDPVALLGPRPNATGHSAPLRPLTPQEKAQAQRDTVYAKALTSAGYKPMQDFLPPLAQRDRVMAAQNPAFAQHLAGLGYVAGKDY